MLWYFQDTTSLNCARLTRCLWWRRHRSGWMASSATDVERPSALSTERYTRHLSTSPYSLVRGHRFLVRGFDDDLFVVVYVFAASLSQLRTGVLQQVFVEAVHHSAVRHRTRGARLWHLLRQTQQVWRKHLARHLLLSVSHPFVVVFVARLPGAAGASTREDDSQLPAEYLNSPLSKQKQVNEWLFSSRFSRHSIVTSCCMLCCKRSICCTDSSAEGRSAAARRRGTSTRHRSLPIRSWSESEGGQWPEVT